jgi:catechol 2,3-dioxygenase-like lactoylglutathione lyase family enzyme
VSDLERSLRFYCQGLGFELVESYTVGSEFGPLMEVEGNIVLQSRFIARDGVRLELLHFDAPGYMLRTVRTPARAHPKRQARRRKT